MQTILFSTVVAPRNGEPTTGTHFTFGQVLKHLELWAPLSDWAEVRCFGRGRLEISFVNPAWKSDLCRLADSAGWPFATLRPE